MNEINIYRRISLIHAVRCNKTELSQVAVNSFETLIDLKNKVVNANTNEIESEINEWMAESPTVSNTEIIDLYNSNRFQ